MYQLIPGAHEEIVTQRAPGTREAIRDVHVSKASTSGTASESFLRERAVMDSQMSSVHEIKPLGIFATLASVISGWYSI